MNAEETKEFVTVMMANVLSDTSVLAPHVAREFAEKVMTELLAAEYLITNGKIHSVTEVDSIGGYGGQWEVHGYSESLNDEGTDEFLPEEEPHTKQDGDDA